VGLSVGLSVCDPVERLLVGFPENSSVVGPIVGNRCEGVWVGFKVVGGQVGVLIDSDRVGTSVGCFVVGLLVDGASAGALVEVNCEGDPLVGLLNGNWERLNTVGCHVGNSVDGNWVDNLVGHNPVGLLVGGVSAGLDDVRKGLTDGDRGGNPRDSMTSFCITYSLSKKQLSKQLPSQKLKHCPKSEFHFKPNLMQSWHVLLVSLRPSPTESINNQYRNIVFLYISK